MHVIDDDAALAIELELDEGAPAVVDVAAMARGGGGDAAGELGLETLEEDEGEGESGARRRGDCNAAVSLADIPRTVYYIIGNEFCERFCYYGFKTILVLYLVNFLAFDKDQATTLNHTFVMLAYFFPLLGGFLSDSYWGKYLTILRLSVVYCIGILLMSITAIPGVTGSPPSAWGAVLSLMIIAVGTGGIKPCVSAFGGDQFQAHQQRGLEFYFLMFYFSINLGSVISTTLTPILRGDVQCFGQDECFPLAFAVPAALMMVALSLFLMGRKQYRRVPPQGNVVAKVASIVYAAFVERRRQGRSSDPGRQFLDGAVGMYSHKDVQDVKELFAVLVIFLPLPLFWTLFDQTGSRWTFQAISMAREVTMFGSTWIIKPDQMQVFNSLFCIVLIPVFDRVVYPLLRRLGLPLRPLQRMGIGMLLCGLSFFITALIQLAVDRSTLGPVPEDPDCDSGLCCVDACVSVFAQVPAYFVLTVGEVMFSVTGLEFAYSQAPASMKSVCQAAWLLTVAMGNLIVIIVAASRLFQSAAAEFFFFGSCMLVVLTVFVWLARRHRYVGGRYVGER